MLKYYSVPHLVHIETTYNCNSRCIFCYNPNREADINYDMLDKIVASVRNSEIPHVYLIGGEPSILDINKLNEYIELLSETSSVTMVTNGLKYLSNLSDKLACIGIPIHGSNAKTHESLTNVKGGYKKTITSIEKYVKDGFDVRCIPVLMSINYNQIYDIISLAKKLKMESVFVDRFEDGGIGSLNSKKLKPSIEQFKIALTQMIKGRDDLNMRVGFGTAIPYCLDERLFTKNMAANCGVGVTFGAISPKGEFRICNQSTVVYGNVLDEPIEKIWNKNRLNEFRDLSWVEEPCKTCPILNTCVCGCKVDINYSNKYCVDYAVRCKRPPVDVNKFKVPERKLNNVSYPKRYRLLKPSKYMKIITKHMEKYLITRYQTIEIDDKCLHVLLKINEARNKKNLNEKDLVKMFEGHIKEDNIRKFLSKLEIVGAIDFMG